MNFSKSDLEQIKGHAFIDALSFFESSGSTNDLALESKLNHDSKSHLFLSASQSYGRGRGQNQWFSAKGALTFSILLNYKKLGINDDKLPLLSLSTGLAIAKAADQFVDIDATIKWPNDVYLADKKLAGILIEHSKSSANTLVIGIGLNVNNTMKNHSLSNLATSIIEQSEAVSLTDVLIAILEQIELQFELLKLETKHLISAMNERSFLKGKVIKLQVAEQIHSGLYQGIGRSGELIISNESGNHSFIAGSIIEVTG